MSCTPAWLPPRHRARIATLLSVRSPLSSSPPLRRVTSPAAFRVDLDCVCQQRRRRRRAKGERDEGGSGGCCRWSDAALIIFPRPTPPPPLSVWLCGGGKGKGERQNAISVISGWARCERARRKGEGQTQEGRSHLRTSTDDRFTCEVSKHKEISYALNSAVKEFVAEGPLFRR